MPLPGWERFGQETSYFDKPNEEEDKKERTFPA